MPADDHQAIDLCPRCGYDQRGVIAQWRDRCPLEGRCAECGLEFFWRDVLHPDYNTPRWCVEFCPAPAVPAAALGTAVRSLRPWRFWTAMRMSHQLRPRRLFAYCLILLVIAYGVAAISHAAVVGGVVADSNRYLYGRTPTNPWPAMARAIVLPLSDKPIGMTGTWRGVGLVSSRDLLRWLEWSGTRGTAMFTALFLLAAPLAFAALPVSRRRAKVRWRHVARVAVYGIATVLPGYLVFMTCQAISHNGRFGAMPTLLSKWERAGVFDAAIWIALVGTALAYLLWWIFAAERYLRMDHSFAVGLTVVVLGLLAALAGCILIEPSYVSGLFRTWFFPR